MSKHSAGKGPKQRPTDFKKLRENYPKTTKEVEGFVRNKKGKLTKKY
jgi:hypothetical protein